MSTLAPEAPVAERTDPKISAALPFWRRSVAFGTGLGIAMGEHNLEAAIVRGRPSGATLIATAPGPLVVSSTKDLSHTLSQIARKKKSIVPGCIP